MITGLLGMVEKAMAGRAKTPADFSRMAVRQSDVTMRPRSGQMFAWQLCHLYRGPVARCADLIASQCAGEQLRLYKRTRGTERNCKALSHASKAFFAGHGIARPTTKAQQFMAGGNVVEIERHPFLDCWNDANPWQTGEQFRFGLFRYCSAIGDFGIWPKFAGSAEQMILPLAPQHLEVVPSRDGFIGEFRWGIDPTIRKAIPAEEVVFVAPRAGIFDPFRGTSWLAQIVKENHLLESTLDGMTAFIENGMNPSAHFALSEGQNADDVERAHAYLTAQYGGPEKWGKMLVTTSAKVQPLTIAPKDSQTLELLLAMERQVCSAAGVPESIYKLNDANLAGATESMRMFGRYTLQPLLGSVGEIVSEQMLPMWNLGPEYFATYDSVVPEDEAAKMNKVTTLVNIGMPPNDALARVGEAPFEGGDEPKQQAPAYGSFGQPSQSPRPQPKPQEPEDDDEDTKIAKHLHRKRGGCCVTKDRLNNDPIERLIALFAGRLEEWQRRVFLTAPITDGGLEPTAAQLAEFEAILSSEIPRIFNEGGLAALDFVGEPQATVTLMDPAMQAAIRTRINDLVTTVPQTMRDSVASAITTGTEQGQTITQITTGIRTEAPHLAAYQAERIARTEAITGYNGGQFVAYTAAGVPFKTWEVAGGPCELCEAFGAKYGADPIPMEATFDVEGVSLPYPPAHPNCRCVLIPTYVGAEGKFMRASRENRKKWKGVA